MTRLTMSASVMIPSGRSSSVTITELISIELMDLATSSTVASGGIVTTFTAIISRTSIDIEGSDIKVTSIKPEHDQALRDFIECLLTLHCHHLDFKCVCVPVAQPATLPPPEGRTRITSS